MRDKSLAVMQPVNPVKRIMDDELHIFQYKHLQNAMYFSEVSEISLLFS